MFITTARVMPPITLDLATMNAPVRRGMIQLVGDLMFRQTSSAQWFRARTENARGTCKTMIVALARKFDRLWRLVREGVDGIVLRPA